MSRLIHKLDRFPLWSWVVLSLVMYIILALWFPLLPHYNHVPLSDVRSLAPSLAGGLAYGVLVSLLFAFFVMAYRYVRTAKKKLSLAKLLGVSFLFALPLLLVYPINASDIISYVISGRIQSVYGENPYITAPDQFADDPFLPLAGEWAGSTSPYGPLWELMTSFITWSTDGSLLLGLLSFKLLGLLAFLGSAVLLWLIFTTLEEGAAGGDKNQPSARAENTVLWAWNPALLLIFVVNGHNDALMIFCMLLGYLFIHRGHEQFGFLLMMLGPLVKLIALLALPMFFISIWRARPSFASRSRFLAVSAVGGLLMVLLAFFPFGSPWQLGERLLQEGSAGAGFSLAATFILISQALELDLAVSLTVVAQISTLLFGLFVLWLLWLTWRGRSALRGTADVYLAYVLQALNFRIWYASWPFPWLLLDAAMEPQQPRAAYRLRYGLWFLLTTQLSVILYGHIRIYLLDGSQLWAHILGMLFVFVLPLILARAASSE